MKEGGESKKGFSFEKRERMKIITVVGNGL